MIERLDLTGLKCPLPALKTRKALARLSSGTRIEVVSTDPLAGIDIPALLNDLGHRLVKTVREDGRAVFLIEVQAGMKPCAEARINRA